MDKKTFNIIKLFCLYIISIIPSLVYAVEPIGEPDIKPGKARIRIWSEALPERVGHVSLATQRSYISLWPSAKDREHVTFKNVTYAHSAAACNVEDYATDLAKEEGLEPSYVFEVSLETEILDSIWAKIRTKIGALAIDEKHVSLPGITWLAVSHPKNMEGFNFNCASAVLLALEIGGLKTDSFVTEKVRLAELVGNLGSFLSEAEERAVRELRTIGFLYGAYNTIIKPNDIYTFLTNHISEGYGIFFEEQLCNGNFRIDGAGPIDAHDRKALLKQLLRISAKKTDKHIKNIFDDFIKMDCKIRNNTITLSPLLIEIIEEDREFRKNVTTTIRSIGISAAVIGGVYLLNKSTNGKCSIM